MAPARTPRRAGSRRATRRRTFVLRSVGWLPAVLAEQARQLSAEVEYLRRPRAPPPPPPPVAAARALDASFAAAAFRAVYDATGLPDAELEAAAARIAAREGPTWPGGPATFDLQLYAVYKAAAQRGVDLVAVRPAVGAALLAWARDAGAVAPLDASEPDGVREAVTALVGAFQDAGYSSASGVSLFGGRQLAQDSGPAFLKLWAADAQTLYGAGALLAEEGSAPDLLACAVEALLREGDLEPYRFQRLPSLSEPRVVAQQWTVRRATGAPRAAACPDNVDDVGCYVPRAAS